MGIRPSFVEVANAGEIERAIVQIAGERADALVVRGDSMFFSNREPIGRLAMQYALPTIAEDQRFGKSENEPLMYEPSRKESASGERTVVDSRWIRSATMTHG